MKHGDRVEKLKNSAMIILQPLSSPKKDIKNLSEELIAAVEEGNSQNLVKKIARNKCKDFGFHRKIVEEYALATRSLAVLRRDHKAYFDALVANGNNGTLYC